MSRTFASVQRHRNYRLYVAGQAVSFTGTWMQQIAASWLVLTMTHSAVAVGALALCQLLPVSLLGLFVGSVIDRLDRRRTVLTTESLGMLNAAVLAALTLTGVVTTWEIYALAVLQGTVAALDQPARHALVFQIVGRRDLANAVALSSSLGTLGRVVGPGIGGAVVAAGGPGTAFAVNAASFLAIIGCLAAMDPSRFAPAARDAAATLLGGAAEAFRFLGRTRRAAVAFGCVLALSTFSFNFNVLLPLLAGRTLHAGATTFGVLAATFGAGALCGAILNASLARSSMRLLIGGAVCFGLAELAIVPLRAAPAVAVLLFAVGVASSLWDTNGLTTLQLAAPERLRGRASGLYWFAYEGGAPFGGLLAGWLVALDGTNLAFAVAGGAALVTAAIATAALRRGTAAGPTSALA